MKRLIYIIFIFVSYYAFAQQLSWDESQNITELNSKYDEFAPIWNKYSGQLFFNSTKSGYSKFYLTERSQNNSWQQTQIVEGEINIERNNQSYIAFESKDVAYLSTYRVFNNRSYLNIFQSRKKKNQWLKPFKLDSLELPVFMGHPTISPDGSFLIFSSDYNSEFEDTDLWMAFKQDNGTWGALIRVTQVKSPGNEITPFLASNDTLFFASDGQEGPGGYDIFISVRVQGIWQMPYPVKELNTEFDESDFTLLPDGSAVFSSNRPGGLGGLDLYFAKKSIKKSEAQELTKVDFSIEAQTPFIKVEGESINKSALLSPVFIYDSILFVSNENSIQEIQNTSIKFLDKLSINKIRERVVSMKEPSLVCTVFFTKINDKKQNELYDRLNHFFQFNNKNVDIIFTQLPKQIKDLIHEDCYFLKFGSSNKQLFDHYDINITPIQKIIPPALDLSLDARPRNIISDWNITLKIGNTINEKIKSGNELPANFYHSIINYDRALKSSDSLLLIIEAKDEFNNRFNNSQVFNITHSEIEDDGNVTLEGKKYLEYWISLIDENDLREDILYTHSFSLLAEKAIPKKRIIINYFSDNALPKAKSLKDVLSEQINGGEFEIIIQKTDNDNNYLPNSYLNFVYKILIEI